MHMRLIDTLTLLSLLSRALTLQSPSPASQLKACSPAEIGSITASCAADACLMACASANAPGVTCTAVSPTAASTHVFGTPVPPFWSCRPSLTAADGAEGAVTLHNNAMW